MWSASATKVPNDMAVHGTHQLSGASASARQRSGAAEEHGETQSGSKSVACVSSALAAYPRPHRTIRPWQPTAKLGMAQVDSTIESDLRVLETASSASIPSLRFGFKGGRLFLLKCCLV